MCIHCGKLLIVRGCMKELSSFILKHMWSITLFIQLTYKNGLTKCKNADKMQFNAAFHHGMHYLLRYNNL